MENTSSVEFIDHPFIKQRTVEARLYQQVIAARVLERGNTLVVAPTALGKTIIAALVAAERLRKHGGRVLFLAPTKPLATQHAETLRKVMNVPEEKINVLTGEKTPEKRKEVWEESVIVCATPQTVENDIVAGRIELTDVVLLIVDEAHRAVGDYPYVFIAEEYMKRAEHPLILALTASPGSTEEKIEEVRQNLFIKNIEIRTPADPDVKPYIHRIKVEWRRVDLPEEFERVKRLIESFMRDQLRKLKEMDILASSDIKQYSKKDILSLQESLSREVFDHGNKGLSDALLRAAAYLKAMHALELLETQGLSAFVRYAERMKLRALQPRAPASVRLFASDERTVLAYELARKAIARGIEHPKFTELERILSEFFNTHPSGKAIVFVHYRDTAAYLEEILRNVPGVVPVRFVGQASRGSDKGLTQKKQREIIQAFREGKYNTLVATSVAEEGLDIPAVDLVVFYEAVPSEIRAIQRRGRTGRFGEGRVIVLVAKNTRDEAYYWAARARERKMLEMLRRLKKVVDSVEKGQMTLDRYVSGKEHLTVIADAREVGSRVLQVLHTDPDIRVIVKQLDVGDYIVSDRVCFERKTVADFVQSIIDGRLFEQASALADNFPRPVIIVERDGKPKRNVHPNAVFGALSALAVDYGISVIFTDGPEDTARLIKITAKREQEEKNRVPRMRGDKRVLSTPEMQRYIVESLPFVGPKTAKELLKTFGSVEAVFTASERDLARVNGIGPKKAKEIRKIITEEYNEGEG